MADHRPLTAGRRPLTAGPNPLFTDEPLGATALAAAMGELPRPLDWRKPSWAAAVRLVRALLAGRPRYAPPGWSLARRLGAARALFSVIEKAEGGTTAIYIYVHIHLRPGTIQSESDWMSRTTLSGVYGAPHAAVDADFFRALQYPAGARDEASERLVVGLKADSTEPAFFADLQALAEEIGRAERGTP